MKRYLNRRSFVKQRMFSAAAFSAASLDALSASRKLLQPTGIGTKKVAADVALYPFKNNWAAHVITEHFAPNPERRLLVVYGDGHIYHNGGNMMSSIYAKIDRRALFVVGTVNAPEDDVPKLARLGDPARPFYVSGRGLPSAGPYPRRLFYVRDDPLAHHVDAVVSGS